MYTENLENPHEHGQEFDAMPSIELTCLNSTLQVLRTAESFTVFSRFMCPFILKARKNLIQCSPVGTQHFRCVSHPLCHWVVHLTQSSM